MDRCTCDTCTRWDLGLVSSPCPAERDRLSEALLATIEACDDIPNLVTVQIDALPDFPVIVGVMP